MSNIYYTTLVLNIGLHGQEIACINFTEVGFHQGHYESYLKEINVQATIIITLHSRESLIVLMVIM